MMIFFYFSRCILNCNRHKIIPKKLMAQKFDCKNCGPSAIVVSAYVWTLYRVQNSNSLLEVPYSTWLSKSPTGNKKEMIVLSQGVLNASSSYRFIVTGELTHFLGI